MLNDFVEKYSNILDGRDVKELFSHLANLTNKKLASQLCDLERRTTYYWKDDRAVRLETKRKVLNAVLKKDFEFTVKYLLVRVCAASTDILQLYLGTIYEQAMVPEMDVNQFQMLAEDFRKMRVDYSSLLTQRKNTRVNQMFVNLQKRAKEKGALLDALPISAMNVDDITLLLPRLMRILPRSLATNEMKEYAHKYNLSLDFIRFVTELNSLSKIVSHKVLERDASNTTPIRLLDSVASDGYAASEGFMFTAWTKPDENQLPENLHTIWKTV